MGFKMKKVLGLLLSLVLMLGLMPAMGKTALAADVTSWKVGDTANFGSSTWYQFNDSNSSNSTQSRDEDFTVKTPFYNDYFGRWQFSGVPFVDSGGEDATGAIQLTPPSGKKSADYVPAGFRIKSGSGMGATYSGAIFYSGSGVLSISLEGENIVTSTKREDAGIWSGNGITIGGTGSLTASATHVDGYYGIRSGGELKITAGTVTATAPSQALRGGEGVTITGGPSLRMRRAAQAAASRATRPTTSLPSARTWIPS